jgi:hypothetical protein
MQRFVFIGHETNLGQVNCKGMSMSFCKIWSKEIYTTKSCPIIFSRKIQKISLLNMKRDQGNRILEIGEPILGKCH